MPTKVPIVTDTHFGARTDSVIFHKYFMRFFDELFFPWMVENDVKQFLHLGDFTDRRKYINFYTLSNIRKDFIAKLEKYGISMVCTVGNHDTFFKNTNDVNSVRELFGSHELITIIEKPTYFSFGIDHEYPMLLMPWINESNFESSMEEIKTTKAKVLMGHLEIKGFTIELRGQKAESGLDADIFKKFDLVCSGHYHHKSSEGNIHYLGAPYEMTFADVNDPRGFHIWDYTTNELEFIQNPHRMFHRVYYDDKDKTLGQVLRKINDKLASTHVKIIVQNKTNPYYFEQFLEKLFSISPADVKIEENMEFEDSEDVVDMAEDTLTILNKYVDGLDIDSDKSKIKEEIHSLYVEASNLER